MTERTAFWPWCRVCWPILTFDLRAVIDLYGLLCLLERFYLQLGGKHNSINAWSVDTQQTQNTHTHTIHTHIWYTRQPQAELDARLWLDDHANGRKVAFYNFAISATAAANIKQKTLLSLFTPHSLLSPFLTPQWPHSFFGLFFDVCLQIFLLQIVNFTPANSWLHSQRESECFFCCICEC